VIEVRRRQHIHHKSTLVLSLSLGLGDLLDDTIRDFLFRPCIYTDDCLSLSPTFTRRRDADGSFSRFVTPRMFMLLDASHHIRGDRN
jgi:hypothetical protein